MHNKCHENATYLDGLRTRQNPTHWTCSTPALWFYWCWVWADPARPVHAELLQKDGFTCQVVFQTSFCQISKTISRSSCHLLHLVWCKWWSCCSDPASARISNQWKVPVGCLECGCCADPDFPILQVPGTLQTPGMRFCWHPYWVASENQDHQRLPGRSLTVHCCTCKLQQESPFPWRPLTESEKFCCDTRRELSLTADQRKPVLEERKCCFYQDSDCWVNRAQRTRQDQSARCDSRTAEGFWVRWVLKILLLPELWFRWKPNLIPPGMSCSKTCPQPVQNIHFWSGRACEEKTFDQRTLHPKKKFCLQKDKGVPRTWYQETFLGWRELSC